MNHIYILMGKSSSGKDTLYQDLIQKLPELKTVVSYTTRPIRSGETNGVQYYFLSIEDLRTYQKQNKIIEMRTYHTRQGNWHYATIDDGQFADTARDCLLIGTLESYQKIRDYYGSERVIPLYIEVPDRDRLLRAIHREEQQQTPHYDELCRRFLTDTDDFSEDKLIKAGITRRYQNLDKTQCLSELIQTIQQTSQKISSIH